MFDIVKESLYRKKYASKDALALKSVLGNKEQVMQVITQRSIEGGKWRYVVKELYKRLQDEDKRLLLPNGYALEMGEYSSLWELFTHHEKARIEAMPNLLELYVDTVLKEAEEAGFDVRELSEMLQSKVCNIDNGKNEPQETAQQEAAVSTEESEEDGAVVEPQTVQQPVPTSPKEEQKKEAIPVATQPETASPKAPKTEKTPPVLNEKEVEPPLVYEEEVEEIEEREEELKIAVEKPEVEMPVSFEQEEEQDDAYFASLAATEENNDSNYFANYQSMGEEFITK